MQLEVPGNSPCQEPLFRLYAGVRVLYGLVSVRQWYFGMVIIGRDGLAFAGDGTSDVSAGSLAPVEGGRRRVGSGTNAQFDVPRTAGRSCSTGQGTGVGRALVAEGRPPLRQPRAVYGIERP